MHVEPNSNRDWASDEAMVDSEPKITQIECGLQLCLWPPIMSYVCLEHFPRENENSLGKNEFPLSVIRFCLVFHRITLTRKMLDAYMG